MKRINPPARVGDVIGNFTVLSLLPSQKGRETCLCRCVCGTEKAIQVRDAHRRHVISCGCMMHPKTHGMRNTPEYNTWSGMKKRCLSPKHVHFADYGGRGISICERWRHSFENFYADMGPRPDGMSLDRYPDNDGNYEPGNCRWATQKQQIENSRLPRVITIDGVSRNLQGWCSDRGIHRNTVYGRMAEFGWTVERAITTPVMSRRDRGLVKSGRIEGFAK